MQDSETYWPIGQKLLVCTGFWYLKIWKACHWLFSWKYEPWRDPKQPKEEVVRCLCISKEKKYRTNFYIYDSVIIPSLHRRGYTVLPLSVLPSIPRYFSSHFSQQLLMAEIWYLSQASYRYPISWEMFLDPSHSYFLFAEERGYHTCKWALAHSSSCFN